LLAASLGATACSAIIGISGDVIDPDVSGDKASPLDDADDGDSSSSDARSDDAASAADAMADHVTGDSDADDADLDADH
jgi:hypothetical protein